MTQPSIPIPFAIGETVYHAEASHTKVQVPCPTCHGKKRVTMILGNDDRIGVPCEHCALGWDGPRGFIIEHRYPIEFEPRQIVLARITDMRDDEVTYADSPSGSTCYHIYSSKNLHRDRAKCVEECQQRTRENLDHHVVCLLNEEKRKRGDMISHVGFRLRDRDALRKKIATLSKKLEEVEMRLSEKKEEAR